ncbi:MAG: hypothetical protein NC397_03520 [Clostridium sp.]|nr:hypothetical protein [Clostridium sp.]
MNFEEFENCIFVNNTAYEKYKRLKVLGLKVDDKFVLVNTLNLKLHTLIDSLGSDLYDENELFSDIESTINDLYNYCLDYSDILETYLRQKK